MRLTMAMFISQSPIPTLSKNIPIILHKHIEYLNETFRIVDTLVLDLFEYYSATKNDTVDEIFK